jgi:hypothetical protein
MDLSPQDYVWSDRRSMYTIFQQNKNAASNTYFSFSLEKVLTVRASTQKKVNHNQMQD